MRQLDQFQQMYTAAVSASGGVGPVFSGDSGVAEFPTAEAAARAASMLIETFAAAGADVGAECRLRIGVHLGEVSGSVETGLYGDGVAVASRLQEEADPDTILVSEDVQRQLRNRPIFVLEGSGTRKLRGFDDPVLTWNVRLRRDGELAENGLGSRVKEVMKSRRTRVMISVVGIYFAALWTGVQIAAFIEARYQLSPNLTDVVLAAILLMLPSVLLVAYYHSGPSPERIPLPEKVGVPANLIVASIVVVLAFGAQDIGAVMQTVTVVDEDGQSVERQVPKSQYRKRVAVFPFRWEGAPEDAWLSHGLAWGLSGKLAQDIFFDAHTAADFKDRLRRTDFPDGVRMPAALQREIAQQRHLAYFVTGSARRLPSGELAVTMQVYDTQRGRQMTEHVFNGSGVLGVADAMSDSLKVTLGLPSWHLDSIADLPITEMYTPDEGAFRDYVKGAIAAGLRDDFASAVVDLERAIATDPTFAMAHLTLFGVYFASNRGPEALAAIEETMRHLYRLPERVQVLARHNYLYMKQDIERSYAVIDMGAELFPEDLFILTASAQIDVVRGRRERALQTLLRIMELDTEQHQLLHQAAGLAEVLGREQEAHEFHQRYIERFPQESAGFLQLYGFLQRAGRHDDAAAALERAAAVDADNPAIVRRRATVAWNRGDFDEAWRWVNEALGLARSAEQRVAVLDQRLGMYERSGQMSLAVRDLEAALAESATFQPPVLVILERMRGVRTYVLAGQHEVAESIVDGLEAQLQPPWDIIASLGRLGHALVVEDPDRIEAAVPLVERVIEMMSMENVRPMVVHGKARALELRGQCQEAIPLYLEQLRLEPTDKSIHNHLGRCHHALGNYPRAVIEHRLALRVNPMDAKVHHELALVLRDQGDIAGAREHLETALRIWEPADPDFRDAARAREALASLE